MGKPISGEGAAKSVTLRFYAELTDFLDESRRSGRVEHSFEVSPGVKDVIESCGVPHTEVDLIVVNGKSVDFSYRLDDGDFVSVYPVFESFDVSPILRVRAEPLRTTRFLADNHLGKLARFLRLLGFDTSYDQRWQDPELVSIAVEEGRILLTRDIALLKIGRLTHGYYVRTTSPRAQLVEVVERFHLQGAIDPFTRCMACNGLFDVVDKGEIAERIPPITRELVDEYSRCSTCERIFWKGSHHSDLEAIVDSAREAGISGHDRIGPHSKEPGRESVRR